MSSLTKAQNLHEIASVGRRRWLGTRRRPMSGALTRCNPMTTARPSPTIAALVLPRIREYRGPLNYPVGKTATNFTIFGVLRIIYM